MKQQFTILEVLYYSATSHWQGYELEGNSSRGSSIRFSSATHSWQVTSAGQCATRGLQGIRYHERSKNIWAAVAAVFPGASPSIAQHQHIYKPALLSSKAATLCAGQPSGFLETKYEINCFLFLSTQGFSLVSSCGTSCCVVARPLAMGWCQLRGRQAGSEQSSLVCRKNQKK